MEEKMVASWLACTAQGHRRQDLLLFSNSLVEHRFNCSETQGLLFIATAKAYTDANPFGLIPFSYRPEWNYAAVREFTSGYKSEVNLFFYLENMSLWASQDSHSTGSAVFFIIGSRHSAELPSSLGVRYVWEGNETRFSSFRFTWWSPTSSEHISAGPLCVPKAYLLPTQTQVRPEQCGISSCMMQGFAFFALLLIL